MLIAITGAGGFVGRATVAAARAHGHRVRRIVRTVAPGDDAATCVAGDLAAVTSPDALFAGCDAVIHLAARVHVTRPPVDDEARHDAVNHVLTVRLAEAAARVGVRRFVFASSVAAMASRLPHRAIADDAWPDAPLNAYGRSKLAAEEALAAMPLSTVSLRPPTVYGPGVGAFFAQLMAMARRGVPLPLGAFDNLRSFIYVDNVADALVTAAEGLGRGKFIVTDSAPLATAGLYRQLLRAAGRKAWVPALPRAPIAAAARLLLGERAESLLGTAAFDGHRFAGTFGWRPPIAFDEAIRRTVAAA